MESEQNHADTRRRLVIEWTFSRTNQPPQTRASGQEIRLAAWATSVCAVVGEWCAPGVTPVAEQPDIALSTMAVAAVPVVIAVARMVMFLAVAANVWSWQTAAH